LSPSTVLLLFNDGNKGNPKRQAAEVELSSQQGP
jgi:hypothetical protein